MAGDSTTHQFSGIVWRMWKAISRFLDRFESKLSLFLTLGGSSAMGLLTGWIASLSDFVGSWGAIGWWIAGLFGALATALTVMAVSFARYYWVSKRAMEVWAVKAHSVNPLDELFTRVRIRLSEIEHPLSGRIKGKTFTGCEIIGPSNIFLKGSYMNGVRFENCDFVHVIEGRYLHNLIVVDGCNFTGGAFIRCTIFGNLNLIKSIGVLPVTLTGDAELDAIVDPKSPLARPPQQISTEGEKPQ